MMNEDNIDIKKCRDCKNIASILCMDCYEYFCDECSKSLHNKECNKAHKIEKINQSVLIDTKCKDHTAYPLELFCLDEKGNIYI